MLPLNFRRRLFLAFLIPTALLAFALTLSLFARTRAMSISGQILNELVPINFAVSEVQYETSRLISSVNEYVLDAVIEENAGAADEMELADIQEARFELMTRLDTLREQFYAEGNLDQTDLFTNLETAVGALLAVTDEITATEISEDSLEDVLALRTRLESVENDLIQATDALFNYEQNRFDTLLIEVTQFSQRTTVVWGALILLFIAVPFGVATFIIRSILRPLGKLMSVAKNIGSGDMSARANLDPNDEIGQLGLALDAMAMALEERERAFAELTASLEKRVSQRTDELAAATREAKEANRLKSEFLATMSHELRTPLNAIEGFSSIMLSGMGVELSDRAENMVSRISANSKRLLHLVNDILDISRVEAGRMEINPEPLSPQFLVEKWEHEVSVLAQEKHLEFNVTFDPRLPEVIYHDEFALSKITINLLSNAFKFTTDGEVTLELLRQGDDLQIVVADSGVGIPFHAQEYIFEEFRQVDGSTTRKFGGTGLGLALVQKLVRTMDGTIRLDSEPGIGSVFTVTLPLNEELPAEVQTEIETGIPA